MNYSAKNWVAGILVSLPVILFFLTIGYMHVNAPYQDDFDGLLEPTTAIAKGNHTCWEVWKILSAQDDERRVVMNRLVAFSVFEIFGDLDLRKQIIAGTSTLLIFLALVINWLRKQRLSLFYLVPISFVLFNIQFFDAVFWAMIPVQQIGVFIWAFTSLYFLDGSKWRHLSLSIFFSLFSLYSDVTGFLMLPIGFILLILQKEWKAAGVWLGVFGLIVAYYFYGLKIPAFRPSFASNIAHPVNLVGMYIAMHGLWLDPGPGISFNLRIILALLTGGLLAGWVFWSFVLMTFKVWFNEKRFSQRQTFVWGGILFLSATFLIFVLGRTSEGFGAIFNTRYRLLYLFWVVFCYLLAINNKRSFTVNSYIKSVLIGASIIYCLAAYLVYWGEMDYFRKVLLTDAYEWKNNRTIPSTGIYQTPRVKKAVDNIYESAYKTGVYLGPDYPFANLFNAKIRAKMNVDVMNDSSWVIISVPDLERSFGKNDGVYIIIKSKTETHIFPAKHGRRPVHRMLLSGQYYYPGATTEPISKTNFKSKTLHVEIGVIDAGKCYRLQTNQQVNL